MHEFEAFTVDVLRDTSEMGRGIFCAVREFQSEQEAQREREYCAARHEGEMRVSHHRMTMVQRKGRRV